MTQEDPDDMLGAEPDDPYVRALRILRLGNFASVYDRYTMPAMMLAIATDFDASMAQVSFAVSAYFLAYGLMQPLWGVASSRYGPAHVLRFCATAGVVATLLAVLSPSLGALVASRAVGGGLLSALVPASLIYTGSALPDASRQRGLTALMTANALGTTTATAASGVVGTLMGWRWALVVSLLLVLAAATMMYRLRDPSPAAARRASAVVSLARTLRCRYALVLLALVFAEGAGVHGCLTFLPTALEFTGLSMVVSSASIMFFGLAVVVTATVVGRLSTRTPASVFLAVGAAAGACGAAVIGLLGSLLAGVIAAGLLGLTWGMSHSSLQTWATQVLPAERAMFVALFATCLFAGNAASTATGGALVSRGLLGLQFLFCSAMLAVVAVVGFFVRRAWERGLLSS
ncbi:MFS transporter [Parafrankia sp. BMG5.11]|uniref:MFS transporter n=1 Tax=Parafrankia sp. BMG5.11 TaxID=222540 RepID=UPI00103ED3C3|nr:MFS transporter [Parafrankia sp. BMG5.11]TCJ34550.1 MFS transporter [Parafrankia sp. BMG5.11]